MRLPPALRLLRINIVLAAASFLSSVLLARALDPAGRGDLANLLLWPTFLANIGLLGVHIYLARQVAARKDAAALYYHVGIRAALVTSIVFSLLCAAILFSGAVPSLAGLNLPTALSAILILPFSAWNALQVQIELGRSNLSTYNWARASFSLLYLGLTAVLWATATSSAETFLFGYLCAAVFSAVSTHILVRRGEHGVSAAPSQRSAGGLQALAATFKAAWPFALLIGVTGLVSAIDRVALSLLFDARTMGIYVIALAMSQLQTIINESISPLFFPRLSQKEAISDADPRWLGMRLRQVVLINALIGVFLMVAAPLLLPLVFGSAYMSSLDIVHLLIAATCLRSMMRPFEEVLKGGNRPLQQAAATIAMIVVFIAGAALAALMHSVQGIALALVIASLTGLGMVAATVSRESGIGIASLLFPRLKDVAALLFETMSILKPKDRAV
ncbi:lipopolysaccharide biosynthesis protein [Taklimakanibacter deserti]|uniref:lipopolysaccharide biosynthesis protein n=1 Tax=Taklimakanibacter deserti TaxID=2267839 RepID=UPI000E646640